MQDVAIIANICIIAVRASIVPIDTTVVYKEN